METEAAMVKNPEYHPGALSFLGGSERITFLESRSLTVVLTVSIIWQIGKL
jgi:hypothetical protein